MDKRGTLSEEETPSEVGPNQDVKDDMYKILERANLLSYYDAFIKIGADDVSQLFDTCGEEFEAAIEAVGMSSKLLHVKRLEKALNDLEHEQGMYTNRSTPD